MQEKKGYCTSNFFISDFGFLKQQCKMTKETNTKQVIDEACNNARNCKITTIASLKHVKIVSEEGQCEELTLNPKLCFVKPK